MFCPECGNKLEPGDRFCVVCGTKITDIEQADNETTEPAVTTAPVDYNEETESSDYSSDTVLDGYTTDSVSYDSPSNTKNKKSIMIFVIIFILILCLGAAALIFVYLYQNSDSYKIQSAVTFIEQQDYIQAADSLSDIYTPQAIELKRFLELENSKNLFISDLNSEDTDDAWYSYSDFQSALIDFAENCDVYYLPQSIKSMYDCYTTAVSYANEFTGYVDNPADNSLNRAFYDVQDVMMNEVEKKNSSRSNTFTLYELQSRVDTSKNAYEILSGYDFDYLEVTDSLVIQNCKTEKRQTDDGEKNVILTSNLVSYVINTTLQICENEICNSQSRIESSLEEFDMDDNLFLTYPSPGYKNYICLYLEDIEDYSDISENRDFIIHALQMDMVYFLITGIQPPKTA